jgi:AcrR family transcriptional regulator
VTDPLADPQDADSKRQVVACALDLFVRKGLNATSIRDIGAAAGYTNPALYKFFASKDELALHVFERCYAWIFERIAKALEGGSFAERLRALVSTWAELADERLTAVLYVNENLRAFWPRVRPALRRRSLLKLLAGLVTQGQREGAVPRDVSPPLAVALIVGTLGQVARQIYFGELARPRELSSQLNALLSAALTRSRT